MAEPTKNLYQRRNAAKKEVYDHEFAKIKTGGLQYAYMPIESIKPIVERAWNNVGIVMDIIGLDVSNVLHPEERTSTGYDGKATKSTWLFVRGTLTLKLVNIDDPQDTFTVEVIGEAKDNSDKVINKVYTSALKNFYKIEFNVSEGPKDDIDSIQSDSELDKSEPAPKPSDNNMKKAAAQDPFFGKKEPKPKIEEKDISDATLNTYLLKASKNAEYAPIIKDAVAAAKVVSVTMLPREDRLKLMAKIEEMI